jgi:hypothetical protein
VSEGGCLGAFSSQIPPPPSLSKHDRIMF